MNLDQTIEAVMFAGAKPFTVKRLCEIAEAEPEQTKQALADLGKRLDESGSAMMLQNIGHEYELVSRPEFAPAVSQVVNEETQGELTRAALEALTILAYRGPMTRPELEQIRGVHSSVIIRNLMMRGLVEEKSDQRLGQPLYAVTFEFLNHLGLSGAEGLPDYAELRGHAVISDMLEQLQEPVTQQTESIEALDQKTENDNTNKTIET